MKNVWKIAVLLLLAANLFFIFTSGHPDTHTYAVAAQAIEVNYAEDFVRFTDGFGHEWNIHSAEGWLIGDVAAILLDDCGTENPADDQIIEIRYGFNRYGFNRYPEL